MKNGLLEKCASVTAGAMLLLGTVSAASAETIVKFPLGSAGNDVAFDGTTFGTVDDGDASTTGDQNTAVIFSGVLAFLPEIEDAIASFSLDSVLASGAPAVNGTLVVQETTGGTFELYDPSNVLLLSGTLSSGALTGTSTDSTGSFFNTTFATFTGGSLAALLDPNTAGLSLALTSIFSAAGPGLHVVNGALSPFSADAAGLLEGSASTQVPEPITAVMLLSGLAVGGAVRRRKAE